VLDPHGSHPDPGRTIASAARWQERGVIGMMDPFEIWDEDRWSHYQRKRGPLDDLRERLAQKGV